MKAVVHERYGPPDVLQLREVPTPAPQPGEILVEVHRTTVNRTDCGFLRAQPFVTRFFSGLLAPRHTSLGCEFAGTVAAVGSGVTRFALGDRVFGFDDVRWGGHAEYKPIPQDGGVARIPDGISFDHAAAATEGAHYALTYLRAAGVGRGTRLLVHGATGAIGSAAVQLAKHAGARVVATSTTARMGLIASLGVDRVIDHQKEDFTRIDEVFDVVLDSVGKSSFGACRRLLVDGGIYLSTELGPRAENPVLGLLSPLYRRLGAKRVLFPMPVMNEQVVEFLAERLARGEFVPVIDRSYPLEEIRSAFEYVETGQKTGNVLIRVR